MKERILTVVIGMLIGAILTTAGFIIYNSFNQKNTQPMMNNNFMNQMPGGNFPNSMMNNRDGNMQGPPEMPEGGNNDFSQENSQQEKGGKSTKTKTKLDMENNSKDA